MTRHTQSYSSHETCAQQTAELAEIHVRPSQLQSERIRLTYLAETRPCSYRNNHVTLDMIICTTVLVESSCTYMMILGVSPYTADCDFHNRPVRSCVLRDGNGNENIAMFCDIIVCGPQMHSLSTKRGKGDIDLCTGQRDRTHGCSTSVMMR